MVNKVLDASFIKTIMNSGRPVALKYAKKTETWTRPSPLPQSVKDSFSKAMEKADVPANADSAIMAETEHPSQSDSYNHYTTVYQDKDGNHITTKHVYP